MTRIGAVSEDQLLSAILELAARTGWLAYHVRNSKAGVIQGDVGFPDLVLARRGRVIFAELKREGRDPTWAQQGWLAALASSEPGAPEAYVWRPVNWLDDTIEAVLR